MSELAVAHYSYSDHTSLIVHKEFKLMALCHILLLYYVGPTWLSSEAISFVCICFHLVRFLSTIIWTTIFILMAHNSVFHLIKCKYRLESLTKENICISDIRVWMIKKE